jgi:hypothetical protein
MIFEKRVCFKPYCHWEHQKKKRPPKIFKMNQKKGEKTGIPGLYPDYGLVDLH